MGLQVEDLEDPSRYRELLKLPYEELIDFVVDYIRRKSEVMVFFWAVCIIFLGFAITIRINIAGYFPLMSIALHTFLGLIVFPLLLIPFHELVHIIVYLISGARRIRVGMDLRQYMFYVTAHRYVTGQKKFRLVALAPFVFISLALILLVFILPGLWKWSMSLLLFVHATMCAGDFAMLNFYFFNRKKKIYTWDDFDRKIAYFYEEIQGTDTEE
ncbi:MAG TPA: DUF3267 domain-containing protein [Bacteroidales bacterium]|jgi:hypothetical protein|nr:DUF3267 domain-containing protein [Bacteroidales bacterium]HQH24140.1 DUF3267 domain-containing protein [Bacteroidales bacterium]HQJ81765.1 DUF3267 domain-containing protein [Bacteroidales bacterium]